MEKARQYFVEPAAFVKENLCYNDGLGITEEDGFLIDRRYFDNYVVMAVQKGKLHHCQCGRHLIAEPGEYVFADLHLPHRYWFDESEPGAILWTHINGGPAMQTVEKIAALSPLPFLGHGAQVPALLQNLLRQTRRRGRRCICPVNAFIPAAVSRTGRKSRASARGRSTGSRPRMGAPGGRSCGVFCI